MSRPKKSEGTSSAKSTIERVFHPSTVKNKLRRQEIFQKLKNQKSKERRDARGKRKKEREELGDQAPPKQEPKTIENTRVIEETLVLPDDEEVLQDARTDELASYFVSGKIPKILMFASRKPSLNTALLLRELEACIPNSEIRDRMHVELKKIIPEAVGRDFTDIIVVHEDRKEPNGLLLVHLPDGPTAHFKLTNFRRGYDIRGHGKATSHRPEVVLNHFGTRLGHTVARMLAALFPHDPQFEGRRVVTFHNQRDYIFFRHHRYIFKNAQRVGLQEIGPRFTLKLRSLQKGTFDSRYGQYMWVHKKKQMDTSRRRFHL